MRLIETHDYALNNANRWALQQLTKAGQRCRDCAVGFSAVLFALKVVLNARSPTYSAVYGVYVPTKVRLVAGMTPYPSLQTTAKGPQAQRSPGLLAQTRHYSAGSDGR